MNFLEVIFTVSIIKLQFHLVVVSSQHLLAGTFSFFFFFFFFTTIEREDSNSNSPSKEKTDNAI